MIFTNRMSQKLLREYLNLMIEKVRSKRKVKTRFGRSKFDIKEFKSLPSIAIQQAYAMNYLEALGQGSSRIVFVLTPKKVLKIARNEKGIAQNAAELEVYTDPATREVAAKIYDTDGDGKWIIADLVRPIVDPKEFTSLTNVPWENFVEDLTATISKTARISGAQLRQSAPKFTQQVVTMAEKGKNKLKLADLTVIDHWGKTSNGKVVILDYGFTEDVAEKHYSTSKKQQPQDDAAVTGKEKSTADEKLTNR